jgi:glycosyltransferase involved in cell wall biosynthesis
MSTKKCCFIPSKNRPHTRTHEMFKSVGIPVLHVVEPQDADSYTANGHDIVILPENNKGLPYSRNFIIDYATQNDYDLIFMCDDDVQVFGRTIAKKQHPDVLVLQEVVALAQKNPYAIVGMDYRQHSWARSQPFSINNGWLDVCIAFCPRNIKSRYTDALELKEDRDWQLENIKNGIDLLRVNYFFFGCPDIGSNKGGLFEKYMKNLDNPAAQRMAMKWSPFVKLINKDGKKDCKADWKLIKKHFRPSKK